MGRRADRRVWSRPRLRGSRTLVREVTAHQPAQKSFVNVDIERLLTLLDRRESLNSLQELYEALDARNRVDAFVPTLAFTLGFDTNAAFRLGLNGSRGTDAVDYLRARHKGPLILPGQVLQEIWNNSLEGLDPKAKRIAKALEALKSEASGIGQQLGATGEAAEDAVRKLVESHSDWIDPSARATFERTLEVFVEKATVAHVPRSAFHQIAQSRHDTKTPPGFRDPAGNNGDFFVWADFLLGALRTLTMDVEAVVFVTNDTKKDWSRNGVPHPILVAEARAIVNRPFHLWTVERFQEFAASQMT
ncbi:PIN-like domain-containing protein [Arthrobacter globiformis]|uniref:PIN-like domain-containing protein n=1 Tax=Arthrobacter globiformis TaxID=1665 RepID=UPI0015533DC7